MKLQYTLVFIFATITSNSQQITRTLSDPVREMIRFYGITHRGNHFFGIATDRKQATTIVRQYMIAHKNSTKQLSYKRLESVFIDSAITHQFFKSFPKGYHVLSATTYNAMRIINSNYSDADAEGLWYYMTSRNISKSEAKKKITKFIPYAKHKVLKL